MKKNISFVFVALFCLSRIGVVDFPRAEISNGVIKALIYLPNAEKGYYTASRFDWSGVTARLEYKGHNFFDAWNPAPYDPKLHDAIVGPVQEFRTPLGYDEAVVGESFVKIGVGSLKKVQEPAYRFGFTYDIVNPGKWTVSQKSDQITFTHELTDNSGYSYLYTKNILLVKGKPLMLLQHSLKNTGKKAIATSVYNHNFFVIDNEPTGPNIKVTFPFDVKLEDKGNGTVRGFGTAARIEGRSILYNRTLNRAETVFSSGLLGYRSIPADYNIVIENLKTRAGVKITSDAAIERMVYWACATTACPEPYVKINVKPGQEFRWKYSYEFFADSTKQ